MEDVLGPTRPIAVLDSRSAGAGAGREAQDLTSFTITAGPDVSPRAFALSLAALADYYRACGGVGFKVDFEFEHVFAEEPVHVMV